MINDNTSLVRAQNEMQTSEIKQVPIKYFWNCNIDPHIQKLNNSTDTLLTMTMLVQPMLIVEVPTMFSSVFALTTSSTITRRSKKSKSVSFGSVIVHEHPIIVGCNPAVSSGVPVTIGWYSVSKTEMSVKEYEEIREPERAAHRALLRQHPSERFALLQNLGFTRHELHKAEQMASMIRELREQSYLDDVDNGDKKLRWRLKMLYEQSQQLKQRRQPKSSSKPVLSTMLRRMVGGGMSRPNTRTHQTLKLSSINVAVH